MNPPSAKPRLNAKHHRILKTVGIAALLFISLFSVRSAQAQANAPDTYTLAATGSWDTGGNWSLNAAPTAANDAIFGSPTAAEIITLGSADVALGLFVTNNSNFLTTFTGGKLTIGADGFTNNGTGTGGVTFASVLAGTGAVTQGAGTLTLSGTNTFTGGANLTAGALYLNNNSAAGTGTITINGGTIGASVATAAFTYTNAMNWNSNFSLVQTGKGITFSGNALLGATVTVTGNGNLYSKVPLVSGVISDGGNGYGLTAAGTFALSGANTFTGTTTINSGANLVIGGSVNGAGALITGTTGSLAAAGSIVDNGTLIFYRSNAVTQGTDFSTAAITGTGGLTQNGGGTLTLNATNTYSGLTSVTSGVLVLAGVSTIAGAATVGPGTTLELLATTANTTTTGGVATSSAAGTGQINVTSTGTAGILALRANADTTFATGTIQGGTGGGIFTFDVNAADQVSTGHTLSLGTYIQGTGSGHAFTTNVTGGSGETLNFAKIEVPLGTATTAETFVVSSGVALTTSNFTQYQSGLTTLVFSGAGTTSIGSLTPFDTKSGYNVALSAGVLNLTGVNSLNGSAGGTANGVVTQSGGTLNLGNAGALNTALATTPATLVESGGGTLDNTSGAAMTLAQSVTQTIGGSFTFTGTNSLNMGTGAVTLTATPTIAVGANVLTEGGVISGAFGVTKAGAGMLTLTAASTYTGATSVTAGALVLSATGSINGSASVALTGTGVLTLNNAAALGDTAALSLVSGTTLNLNGAAGTSETVGSLVLDGTTEAAGTYTAAQLMGLDNGITFSSSNGETLTISAVPEPSTWAMVVAGLTTAIYTLNKRRRTPKMAGRVCVVA